MMPPWRARSSRSCVRTLRTCLRFDRDDRIEIDRRRLRERVSNVAMPLASAACMRVARLRTGATLGPGLQHGHARPADNGRIPPSGSDEARIGSAPCHLPCRPSDNAAPGARGRPAARSLYVMPVVRGPLVRAHNGAQFSPSPAGQANTMPTLADARSVRYRQLQQLRLVDRAGTHYASRVRGPHGGAPPEYRTPCTACHRAQGLGQRPVSMRRLRRLRIVRDSNGPCHARPLAMVPFMRAILRGALVVGGVASRPPAA